ncbi:MAG: integrase [Phycisphaerales bacterium]|nr:integrase [Phycisphaerales bacterium]
MRVLFSCAKTGKLYTKLYTKKDSPNTVFDRGLAMASLIKRDGGIYYLQFCVGGKARRVSTGTTSLQPAKEKQRQFESASLRGDQNSLPTRTPVAQVVGRYVQHIRIRKTAKSAQTDVYYLREAFGAICDELTVTSRRISEKMKKRPLLPGAVQDLRRRAAVIEAASFEQIETAHVSAFISGQVQRRGLAPKTANRYREILCRLFNWAMDEGGVRMPGDKNPVTKVGRYKEHAPEIQFLTLKQIDEQLKALQDNVQLQTMVAMLIYAGLRREELLWLTHDDIDLKTGTYGMIRVRAKTIDGRYWQPKTARNRAVPISSTLRTYLNRYPRRIVPGGWLFPSPVGTWWDCDNFSHDLADANGKAGLRWTCLQFRHSFGSHLAMKGESLYKISTLMGNSPEICRRHYAALLPEALGDSVEFSRRVGEEKVRELAEI